MAVPAAPTASVLDTFTQADGPLSGNWASPVFAGEIAPTVVSNQMKAGASFSSAYWNAATFGNSQEVFCTWQAGRVFLYLRVQQIGAGTMDAYQIDFNVPASNTGQISQVTNEAANLLSSFSLGSVVAGDLLWAFVLGQTVYCYTKSGAGPWTFRGSASGNLATGPGRAGVDISAAGIIDDFGAGTLVNPVSGGAGIHVPTIMHRRRGLRR